MNINEVRAWLENREDYQPREWEPEAETMSNIDYEELRNLFSYHPPADEERAMKHAAANRAAMEYAIAIAGLIEDPKELLLLVRKVLEVRHAVNQAITYDCENISLDNIFKGNEAVRD